MRHWHIRTYSGGAMVDDRRIEKPPTDADRLDEERCTIAEVHIFEVNSYDDMVCFPPCARRLQTAMLEGKSC